MWERGSSSYCWFYPAWEQEWQKHNATCPDEYSERCPVLCKCVALKTSCNYHFRKRVVKQLLVVQDGFSLPSYQRLVRTSFTVLAINIVPAEWVYLLLPLKTEAVFEFVTSSTSLNNTYICEVQPWSDDTSILQNPFSFSTRFLWQGCEETPSLQNCLLMFCILKPNFL